MTLDLDIGSMLEAMTPLFDAYVMVDWSAADGANTGRNSIWVASGYWAAGRFSAREPKNPSTRQKAAECIACMLADHMRAGHRVLVGFDFAYGYTAGFTRAAFRETPDPWLFTWGALRRLVEDDSENHSNRFAVAVALNGRLGSADGPFWVSSEAVGGGLPGRKPSYPYRAGLVELAEFRTVERHLRQRGYQPKPVWQLFAPGSVGSQVLTGIPRLEELRNDSRLKSHSVVWPFQTGWSPYPGVRPAIVHAEVWPRIVPVCEGYHHVGDAAEMLSLVAWCARLDSEGRLEAEFSKPEQLSSGDGRAVREEEGWILGATRVPDRRRSRRAKV